MGIDVQAVLLMALLTLLQADPPVFVAGTVVDITGAVIPGATVQLEVGGAVTAQAQTASKGKRPPERAACCRCLARPLVHSAEVGLAYGLLETANGGTVILAPLAAGVLYAINPSLPFPASLGLIGLTLVASLVILLTRRSAGEAQAGEAEVVSTHIGPD